MPQPTNEPPQTDENSRYVWYFNYNIEDTDWVIDIKPSTLTPVRLDIAKPEELKFNDTTTMMMTVVFDSHEMIREIREEQERMDIMLRRISEKLDLDDEHNTEELESALDVDDDTAEGMIIEYLEQNENVFPSDLAYALNIDIDQVARVLRKLEREGAIGTNE